MGKRVPTPKYPKYQEQAWCQNLLLNIPFKKFLSENMEVFDVLN